MREQILEKMKVLNGRRIRHIKNGKIYIIKDMYPRDYGEDAINAGSKYFMTKKKGTTNPVPLSFNNREEYVVLHPVFDFVDEEATKLFRTEIED